jgi:hypothetical protein
MERPHNSEPASPSPSCRFIPLRNESSPENQLRHQMLFDPPGYTHSPIVNHVVNGWNDTNTRILKFSASKSPSGDITNSKLLADHRSSPLKSENRNELVSRYDNFINTRITFSLKESILIKSKELWKRTFTQTCHRWPTRPIYIQSSTTALPSAL